MWFIMCENVTYTWTKRWNDYFKVTILFLYGQSSDVCMKEQFEWRQKQDSWPTLLCTKEGVLTPFNMYDIFVIWHTSETFMKGKYACHMHYSWLLTFCMCMCAKSSEVLRFSRCFKTSIKIPVSVDIVLKQCIFQFWMQISGWAFFKNH